jgi:hypothetical protein
MTMLNRTAPAAPPNLALTDTEMRLLDHLVRDKSEPKSRNSVSHYSDYRQVKSRLDLAVTDLSATQLKNIVEPMRVYSLEASPREQNLRRRPPRYLSAPRLSIWCFRLPISAAIQSRSISPTA